MLWTRKVWFLFFMWMFSGRPNIGKMFQTKTAPSCWQHCEWNSETSLSTVTFYFEPDLHMGLFNSGGYFILFLLCHCSADGAIPFTGCALIHVVADWCTVNWPIMWSRGLIYTVLIVVWLLFKRQQMPFRTFFLKMKVVLWPECQSWTFQDLDAFRAFHFHKSTLG